MITLEKQFVSGVGGFSGTDVLTYTEIARQDNIAIYQRSRDGKIKDYEVIRIHVKPKGFQIMNGKPLEDDTEMYPSTGQWGKQGWSYLNKGGAKAKMESLLTQAIESDNEEKKEITIPVAEFTTNELATHNSIGYIEATAFIKEAITNGSIQFLKMERKNVKGKESKVYIKTT